MRTPARCARQALLAEEPRLRVGVLSNIHEIPAERIGYDGRAGLGFVGGVHHTPNVDAVRFLVECIMPRVRTRLGAEGIGLRHGEEVLIADTPESFAAAVLELYDDRDRWERLAQAGQACMRARFSFAAARARILDDLAALAGGVPAPAGLRDACPGT